MSAYLFRPRLLTLSLAPLLLAPLLLEGCTTVGPDWHGAPIAAPQADARGQFLRAPADADAAAPAAHWWEALGDPALNDLETRALAGSPGATFPRPRSSSCNMTRWPNSSFNSGV